jgi:hypothetical protein
MDANEHKDHVHVHACWDVYVYQYIDAYLSYLCCEFQLIGTFNEYLTLH